MRVGAVIDIESSLEEALVALLRDDNAMTRIKRSSQFVGVLTPNGMHQASRDSLRA